MKASFGVAVRNYRRCWKQLFAADLLYKVLAFTLLTPLAALLSGSLLAIFGDTVLTDVDFLYFFVKPTGWFCGAVIGVLAIGIVAVELSTLMAILSGTSPSPTTVRAALQFGGKNAWGVLQVAARIVLSALLVVIPFIGVAIWIYSSLLTEYDINYYLKEKPPALFIAFGLGALLAMTLIALLLRFATSWFFAIPLVLFEGVRPADSLRLSRERATGRRRSLLVWTASWVLATTVLSVVVTATVVGLGRLLVPLASGSLAGLAVAIGASLLVWGMVHLVLNLLSTTTLAAMLFHLYEMGNKAASPPRMPSSIDTASGWFRLSRRRLWTLAAVGLGASIAIGAVALHRFRLEDQVVIIAHRGASKYAPENTMAAVEGAIDQHADWVEIDVQETADGTVVVFHDSDFMKLAGIDLKIWDATAADLKSIDIGSWYGEKFKNERVPTLAQVLDACRDKVGVLIELKYYGHDVQLERRVADLVETHDMGDQVLFMSLEIEGVKKMKALRPDWKVGLLLSVAAGKTGAMDADFLAVSSSYASRSRIQAAHRNDKEVFVWTVNDAFTMSRMISRGAGGLITDDPALAHSVLEQRAAMSAPERLLLELAEFLGVKKAVREQ